MGGKELCEAAETVPASDIKSAKAMCFYALGVFLAEAETAALSGCDVDAVEKLRELQAHTEKLIAALAPDQRGRPSLVAA